MDTQQPWWATRYAAMARVDPDFAGRLDQLAERQVDLIERLLQLEGAAPVLDLGCGGGRHSILLQERGHQVTGVDLAPELIELAQTRWTQRHGSDPGPTWVQGDMREPPVQGPFAGVILMDASLGVFDEDSDHLLVLGAILDRLRPGGCLILELFNPYFWSHRNFTRHYPPGSLAADVDLVRTYRFDPLRGRVVDRSVLFSEQGREELPTQSLRAWTPPELGALCAAAGYRSVKFFGTDGWQPPREPQPLDPERSAFMWVVARA